MAKKRVKFQLQDGVKPGTSGAAGSLSLKTALPLSLPPGVERPIALGLTCSHPLQIFPAPSMLALGVSLVDSDRVIPPGVNIVVLVKNVSNKDTVLFERGDTVALAHVLDDTDVVVE